MEEKKASIGRLPVEVQEGRDILTREDTDKLFELFAFYRPKDPRLRDNALRAVWALTLAPYSVDDVREAVVSFDNDYFNEHPNEACLAWNTRAPILSAEELQRLEALNDGKGD